MKKAQYSSYLASQDWLERRKSLIENAGHECNRCRLPRWLSKYVYGEDLHVHHLNYQSMGKELPEDVEILCKRCHEIETFGRSDLRETLVAKCTFCGAFHYDVYSDLCYFCRVVEGAVDFPLSEVLHCKSPVSDRPMWSILQEAISTCRESGMGSNESTVNDVA